MTDACEKITFPQLLLRTVISGKRIRVPVKPLSHGATHRDYNSLLLAAIAIAVTQCERIFTWAVNNYKVLSTATRGKHQRKSALPFCGSNPHQLERVFIRVFSFHDECHFYPSLIVSKLVHFQTYFAYTFSLCVQTYIYRALNNRKPCHRDTSPSSPHLRRSVYNIPL